MQSPAGRWRILSGLSGTAHLHDLFEDERRIQPPALQPRNRHPGGLRLGGHERAHRRGAGGEVQGNSRHTWQEDRHPGRNLHAGHQQDQQRRHTLSRGADDRQGEVGLHVLRREGRDLRGPFAEERRGYQERRGPVFHAAPADPRHGALPAAPARRDRGRKNPHRFDTNK